MIRRLAESAPVTGAECVLRICPHVTVDPRSSGVVLSGIGGTLALTAKESFALSQCGLAQDWQGLDSLQNSLSAHPDLLDRLSLAGCLEKALRRDPSRAPFASVVSSPGQGLRREPVAKQRLSEGLTTAPHLSLTPENAGVRIEAPSAQGWGWLAADLVSDWLGDPAADPVLADLFGEVGLIVPKDQVAGLTGSLSAHDQWFHMRTRLGLSGMSIGADPEADVTQAPVALPAHGARAGVALKAPAQALAGNDAAQALTALFSQRRSRRAAGTAPNMAQLSALLWMVAHHRGDPVRDAMGFERLWRTVPSAGAAAEIDLWLVMPDLIARYDGALHRLMPVQGDPTPLLTGAAATMGQGTPPPAMVVLSARFERLSWKYGDLSYSLILKDAGVILQSLHLAATSLGIGSCILGGGDARAFANLTDTDPQVEGPVGEIALTGLLPDPDQQNAQGILHDDR